MYIRYIFTDFTFFYEDYITKPEGIIFENFFTNHKINCNKYDCFCTDFNQKVKIYICI